MQGGSLSIPHHCRKEERIPRIVSSQKRHLSPSLSAKARHMAIPRSDPITLFGSRLRVSGNCPEHHSVSIADDGDLCGLLPEEFKVISVFTSNPQLREIGRLLVSLLLEEGEVEGHREEELVTYLKPQKIRHLDPQISNVVSLEPHSRMALLSLFRSTSHSVKLLFIWNNYDKLLIITQMVPFPLFVHFQRLALKKKN